MANGNVTIRKSGGGATLGVIPVSGSGLSFLNPLYRYANLTLPYSPNDPGLTFTYDNSSLAPVVLLYARFFNLLNEASVPLVANVGTTAFSVTGGPSVTGATDCLDVRTFGAVGDGVANDTNAIQAALDAAYSNYLGNQLASGQISSQASRPLQTATGHVENGSTGTLAIPLLVNPTLNNTLVLCFSAFDYGGGAGSPATPTVTDNRGNVWTRATVVQNGELLLYVYYAKVGSASSTTVTITIPQLQFNSFISAVLSEYSGVLAPITVDGSATTVVPSGSFAIPQLTATGHNDLVVYAVSFDEANGIAPVPPSDFTLVGYQANPQPNGLNGAVPVTAVAYKNWLGTPTIISGWTAVGYNGGAAIVAFRQTSLPIGSPGKTVVCIPQGVSCLVRPRVVVDHEVFSTFPWPSSAGAGYQRLGYSLVMNDGVTLRIDGTLIADPTAVAASITGAQFQGDIPVGWALIMNSAWLQNTGSIGKRLLPSAGVNSWVVPWSNYLAGTAFDEGPRNTGIKITGIGKVLLNGQVQANTRQANSSASPVGLYPTSLLRFYCVDNGSVDGLEIVSPWYMAVQWGHSTGVKISNLYIHDAPNGWPGGAVRNNGVVNPTYDPIIFPSTIFQQGIIEADMLRNSVVSGNRVSNCPRSWGIRDSAGYQNSIVGNTITACVGGYLYTDMGEELTWSFGPPLVSGQYQPSFQGMTFGQVSHNTEIASNVVSGCTTRSFTLSTPNITPPNPIPVSTDDGSVGFLFRPALSWFSNGANFEQLPVTGTSLHDNIATGNATDFYFTAGLMSFRVELGNSFDTGNTPVVNGVTAVIGEVPSGAVNGTNVMFTLAHTPVSGTISLYLNGLLQTPSIDFSVSGNTITLTVAPNPGSVLSVNYQYSG